MAHAPTAITSRGAGVASQVWYSARRMFVFTAPVITSPSAWRGEATNWTPKRARSNTTFPRATSSASQPLQLPATTDRRRKDRPNSCRIRRSSATASSTSPSGLCSPARVLAAMRWSLVNARAPFGHAAASSGANSDAPTSTVGGPSAARLRTA